MKHLPEITKELMEYLEGICPDKAPALSATERQIWFDAGKVDLVRHLRSIYEEQSQTIIQGD